MMWLSLQVNGDFCVNEVVIFSENILKNDRKSVFTVP